MMKKNKKMLDFDMRTDEQESALLSEKHLKTPPPLTEKVLESDQRIFYLAVVAILFSFTAVSFSGLNIKASAHQSFVVVDINQLLREKATELVKKHTKAISETSTEIQLAEQAKRVRSVIETYARENNVIVLLKGSAFGATMTEVTDEISALL